MSTTKLRDFLKSMLSKAGTKDDAEVEKIIAHESFDLELPDFITSPIETKTFNFLGAVNNPEIRNKIIADRFGDVERDMKARAKEVFGLSEDKFNELRGDPKERAYNEFLGLLFNDLKASVPTGSKDDSKSAETIRELQTKLEAISKEYDSYKTDSATKQKDMLNEFKLQQLVNAYPLRDDLKDIASEIRGTIASKIKELAILREEGGEMLPFSKADPNARLMNEKNELISLKDLVEKHVSPFLKKSDPGGGGGDKKVIVDKTDLVKKENVHGAAKGIGHTLGRM